MEDEGAVWWVRGGNDNLWPKSVKALDRMMEFPAHPEKIDSRREIDRTVTALAAGSLPSVAQSSGRAKITLTRKDSDQIYWLRRKDQRARYYT